jgi:hypothetical protein
MGAGVVICAVIGHAWHVDETSSDSEAVLCCSRCHRRQLAPNATGFGVRTDVKARAYGAFLKR